jgi:predicted nucleotidyltransferase
VLSHPLDGAVLEVLARTTTRTLTGRQVASLAHEGSQQGVAKALARLVDHGLVKREQAGRAGLYTLNRDHLAAPAVEILVGLRAELFMRLRDEIEGWKISAAHASVFGSTARGDGDPDSDIDLLIVRREGVDQEDPAWRAQLDQLTEKVRGWTGNEVGLTEIAAPDVERLGRERPPVVEDLLSDAVVVAGPDPAQLFGVRR